MLFSNRDLKNIDFLGDRAGTGHAGGHGGHGDGIQCGRNRGVRHGLGGHGKLFGDYHINSPDHRRRSGSVPISGQRPARQGEGFRWAAYDRLCRLFHRNCGAVHSVPASYTPPVLRRGGTGGDGRRIDVLPGDCVLSPIPGHLQRGGAVLRHGPHQRDDGGLPF